MLAGAALVSATPAFADPCKAVPDRGPAPPALLEGPFTGAVTYVGDGDSLCVAIGPHPADWVEVRLADFFAPELSEPGGAEAKAALSRLALGRSVTCHPLKQSYDRIVARCLLAGRSLAERLRSMGTAEGGRGRP